MGAGPASGTGSAEGACQVPDGQGTPPGTAAGWKQDVACHQSAGRMQTLTEFSDVQELSELHDRLEEAGRGLTAAGRPARNTPGHHEGGVVDLTSSRRVPGWRRLVGWRPVS
jgi:hypothetical protein